MTARFLATSVLLLLAAPFGAGHPDLPGLPDPHCESTAPEWSDHDYGPVANGVVILTFIDGNVEDCGGDGGPGDYDGHSEYARGGAWILACEEGCGGLGGGDGAFACFGEHAHHDQYGPFTVDDFASGPTVPFYVAIDDIGPVILPCGDGLLDHATLCVGTCVVTFGPGYDGSYHVFVGDPITPAVGTQGHVIVPACVKAADGNPQPAPVAYNVGWFLGGGGGGPSPC